MTQITFVFKFFCVLSKPNFKGLDPSPLMDLGGLGPKRKVQDNFQGFILNPLKAKLVRLGTAVPNRQGILNHRKYDALVNSKLVLQGET